MSSEALAHAVAGGVAGSVAMGLLYPLDQIRIILQVWVAGSKGIFTNCKPV
jgi:Mitochondrial carrier protein